MGSELAGKIPESRKKIQDYVSDIPRTVNSLIVGNITHAGIEKIILSLTAKPSSGHDGISSKLLKELNYTILYLLSIIFNQSLATSTFLDRMKIAEIVPLYRR